MLASTSSSSRAPMSAHHQRATTRRSPHPSSSLRLARPVVVAAAPRCFVDAPREISRAQGLRAMAQLSPAPIASTQQSVGNAAPRRRGARRSSSSALAATADQSTADVPAGSVSVVLLSGGSGKRMGAPIPKQYLELRGRAIATHSMATFAAMPEVGEIVVVCDPAWRHVFEPVVASELTPRGKKHAWALPGAERQDSVASGLAQVSAGAAIVAVHDSARPLVSADDAARCVRDAWECGAAVLGVPCKQTVKEVDAKTGLVARTLDRSLLWEVQTPQCVRPDLLRRGFAFVQEKGLAVTDDVSVVEALGEPVRITRGCYTNIKVTTPEDMGVAEGFIDEREAKMAKAPAAAAAAAAAA